MRLLVAASLTLAALATAYGPASGMMGAPATAAASEAVTYRLPFPAGGSSLVTQGNAGKYTHIRRRLSEFAWDFLLPQGSMVVAAAEGTVLAVEDGYTGGGSSDAYLSRANYVVLAHADGNYSVYQHLAYRGSLVRQGQRVLAGQGVALSGATGYTTGPHLHFQLQNGPLVGGSQSVPLSFADAGVPEYGDSPTSANTYLPPAPSPRALGAGFRLQATLPSPGSEIYTHQRVPLALDWAPGARVRIVKAEADGSHTVVGEATAGDAAPGDATAGDAAVVDAAVVDAALRVQTAALTPGPVTLWAEYRSGDSWSVLGTGEGHLVTLTLSAHEQSVFLADPGVAAEPLPVATEVSPDGELRRPAPGDRAAASFTIVNLGAEPLRLRNLTLTVSQPTGAPPATEPVAVKSVYLKPGGTYTWSGTVTFPTAGHYTLAPAVEDAGGRRMPLPPTVWGGPAEATVTVESSEPPRPRQTFVDVPPGHPAYVAVEALAARGLVSGYPSGGGTFAFRPEQPVVRAQFAKLLVGALGLPVSELDECPFVDVETSGPGRLYPDNYIAVAAARGITRGTAVDPPRFSPYVPVTLGQAVTMVTRATADGSPGPPQDPWRPATRAETAVLAAALLGPA